MLYRRKLNLRELENLSTYPVTLKLGCKFKFI